MPPRPAPRELRASDADRDRVVAVLNAAVADGRLTHEEHDERVHDALSARTLGDLLGLTTDLIGPAGQPIQIDSGPLLNGIPLVNGIFRKEMRGGRWVVPSELIVNAIGADVTLDFREALLTDRHTVIRGHAMAGTIRMFVPDAVTVTVDGTIFLGRQKGAAPRGEPPTLDQPVIEVRARVFLGEILVKTPPKPRRWLRNSRRQELR
jgi:hypothetical protein